MSFVEKLYAPMSITGKNIDPRYFKENEDGTYTPTPLFIYNVARDVSKFAKARIFELDTDMKFHTASVRQVKDTWAENLHRDEWVAKYGDLIKEASKRWHEYRDAHPDEFEVSDKRIDVGGEDEARFFAAYSADITPGLIDTIKLYNAANKLLTRFVSINRTGEFGPEYHTLPLTESIYSKETFATAHKAVRAKISEDLGIPNDNFEVGKVEKIVCRINNKKCTKIGSDDSNMENFVEGLIKYLTSSNATEFREKREEWFKPINHDFIVRFNESITKLKAKDVDQDSIVIYTCDTTPTKIITISKEHAKDSNYKYLFSVNINNECLQYSTSILTKADLREALNKTITIIKDIEEFKKYVSDIERTIEYL